MKCFRILALLMSFTLVSCSSLTNGGRDVASSAEQASLAGDLSGTQLGVVRYLKEKYYKKKYDGKRFKKTKRFRAMRVYFNKIEGEADSYHAILLEYTNLLRMAPTYVGSNKLPPIQSIFGFLKKIATSVTVYKVTPLAEAGKYEMQLLNARGGQLVATQSATPMVLHLSDAENLSHPLSGARISNFAKSKKGNEVDVFFPEIPQTETKEEEKKRKKEAKFGMQFNLANFVYKKVKLESTWRDNFLPGPYLRAYNDKKHQVLTLKADAGKLEADFVLEKGWRIWSGLRARRFTNKKSASIKGNFEVTKVAKGIFIFSSTDDKNEGVEHVEDRIGVFIDIFDARKSLDQDVVELIMVDSNNPTDFLMYYEHPDNGEGEGRNEEK
ncbi:hypothetical protein A9Q84_15155 [Halobacteriovorax marinus]|uniref:Lipoprotein n=1 Tax=Halobacteriovorax marinus TaxID=97084 RepID=A0A1Y5FBP9_9BACT|nr:hypothetical protein A9Q84_15155 [Halobacteriovorax marinus]